MLVWPPLVIALLYLPNVANIQRRLLDAVYVPLGILAAVAIQALVSRLKPARARRVSRLLVGAACFSSLIVLAIALRFAAGAFSEAYVPNDAWQAMQWLSSHHQPDDRVLSAPGPGLLLPALAGVSVYVGHYSETLDYFKKIQAETAILNPQTSPSDVRGFLAANGITLLYWGPDEQKTQYQPGLQPFLRRVYQSGGVSLYRVVSPGP